MGETEQSINHGQCEEQPRTGEAQDGEVNGPSETPGLQAWREEKRRLRDRYGDGIIQDNDRV